MLLVAASPVFAHVFVGSSGILAPSTAHPADLNCLQGDAYTDNWRSAIRHTPKLARRMDDSTMSLVAELYPDKTHVLYRPRHATIH